MKDDANSFIKRLCGFSLGPVVSAFIGFIKTPLLTWLIVPEEFGRASMFVMASTISALFIYLGIDRSFVREYNAEKDKGTLLWNSFLIPFLFSILVATVYILFWEDLSNLLFASQEKFIIYALSFSLPFSILFRFNTLIIRMDERARLYSSVTIIHALLNLIIVVILLFAYERTFKSIVIAQIASLVLIGVISTIINSKKWFVGFRLQKDLLRRLYKYGLPMIPVALFSWLLTSMDKIALRTWASFDELGLYSAAFRVVMVLNIIQASFSNFWSPTAYKWYENGVQGDKFIKVSRYLSVFFFLVFGVFVIFKDVIVLIMDQSYRLSSPMIPFLLFMPMMYTISETTKIGINFSRKTIYIALITLVASITNLVGNYYLVPIFGGIGASIATGVSFVLYFWLGAIIAIKHDFLVDIKFFFVNITLGLLLAGVSVFYGNTLIEVLIFIAIILYNHKHIKALWKIGLGFVADFKNSRILR